MIRTWRALLRDRALLSFFALAIALSWAYWIPVALLGGTASHFPGLFGPLLAAVVVTAFTGGRGELQRLLGGRGAARWWFVALAPLAITAAVVGALGIAGAGPTWRALSAMKGLPGWPWPAVFLAVFVIDGLGEETGWRGFAWTRLRQELVLRDAALVLTVPWALWHLPLFWIDSGLAGMPVAVIPGWLIGLASGTVVLGWLYERSGSVLVVAVAHTAVNMASGTRGTDGLAAGVVTTAVIAAAILVLAGPTPLFRGRRRRTMVVRQSRSWEPT